MPAIVPDIRLPEAGDVRYVSRPDNVHYQRILRLVHTRPVQGLEQLIALERAQRIRLLRGQCVNDPSYHSDTKTIVQIMQTFYFPAQT